LIYVFDKIFASRRAACFNRVTGVSTKSKTDTKTRAKSRIAKESVIIVAGFLFPQLEMPKLRDGLGERGRRNG
jgi:hypothetical protein